VCWTSPRSRFMTQSRFETNRIYFSFCPILLGLHIIIIFTSRIRLKPVPSSFVPSFSRSPAVPASFRFIF
jgi:hypothetical protein